MVAVSADRIELLTRRARRRRGGRQLRRHGRAGGQSRAHHPRLARVPRGARRAGTADPRDRRADLGRPDRRRADGVPAARGAAQRRVRRRRRLPAPVPVRRAARSAAVVREARCSHPVLVEGRDRSGSLDYRGCDVVPPRPRRRCRRRPRARARWASTRTRSPTCASSSGVRRGGRARRAAGERARARRPRARYQQRPARRRHRRRCARGMTTGGVCEVRDRGRFDDLLAGRRPPRPDQLGGWGLWIANHACDLVQSAPRRAPRSACACGRTDGPRSARVERRPSARCERVLARGPRQREELAVEDERHEASGLVRVGGCDHWLRRNSSPAPARPRRRAPRRLSPRPGGRRSRRARARAARSRARPAARTPARSAGGRRAGERLLAHVVDQRAVQAEERVGDDARHDVALARRRSPRRSAPRARARSGRTPGARARAARGSR